MNKPLLLLCFERRKKIPRKRRKSSISRSARILTRRGCEMILPRSWVGDPFISFPDVEIAYFQSWTIDAGVRRYSLWAGRGRGSIEQTKDRQIERERRQKRKPTLVSGRGEFWKTGEPWLVAPWFCLRHEPPWIRMPGRKGEETRWRSSRTKRERERRVDKGSMEIERRGRERRRKGGRKRSYLTSLQNGTVTNSD